MTALRLSIACLAFALGVAGCGGSEPRGSGSTTPTQASPAQPQDEKSAEDRYRARAGAICRDVDRRVAALPRPHTASSYAKHFEEVVDIGEPAVRKLAALQPPPGLAPQARQAVSLARQEISLLKELAQALRSSPDPTITLRERIRRIDGITDRGDELWRGLGIPDCADEEGSEPAGDGTV